MGIRTTLCNLLNPILRRIDLSLRIVDRAREAPVPTGAMSQTDALRRIAWVIKQLRFDPKAIVDVGASDGRWTVPALSFFPNARFLLIEPLPEHGDALRRLAATYHNISIHQGLVGDVPRKTQFMIYGHKSSLFRNARGDVYGQTVELEMTTLVDVVHMKNFPPPDFIKLDVEGAELQALKGAVQLLPQVEIIQMEVTLMPYRKGMPVLHEAVIFMAQHGFRVLDIFGIYGRPLDGLPVQGECVFIRQNSPLVKDFRWAENVTWS